MPYKDTLADVDYALSREAAFSYRCNACSRCCHNKAIRVGPYEILRLARRLGMTTTQFIEQHTEAGGTVMRMRDENNRACIFLNQQGCSVHPDRPLACRLYPLARWVDPDGQSLAKKYSAFPKLQISLAMPPSTPLEGRIAIVTNAGLDAVAARSASDESASCGRQNRVVLTPRRRRQVCGKQFSQATVAKKPIAGEITT